MKQKILAYAVRESEMTEEAAKTLTHIHVAFGYITREGRLEAGDHPFLRLIPQIRAWNPEIKILLSIVNAEGQPDAFTKVAASPELRASITESARRLVAEEGFDGIDYDWEYPCVPSNFMDASPEDRHNFTLLCEATRKGLDLAGGGLLSIAAGADIYYIESVEVEPLSRLLDYVCLMTYDLKCGFHALSGHHTALYSSTGDYFRNSCDQAMKLFIRSGFPKEMLLMGAAFYTRKWENVPNRCHGFLQYTEKGGGYGPSYDELKENYLNRNGFVRYWDDEAKAPWLFDGSTFISYDDPESLAHKCAYVKREACGGIFYWCHNGDRENELLKAVAKGMAE